MGGVNIFEKKISIPPQSTYYYYYFFNSRALEKFSMGEVMLAWKINSFGGQKFKKRD